LGQIDADDASAARLAAGRDGEGHVGRVRWLAGEVNRLPLRLAGGSNCFSKSSWIRTLRIR
jgi:hypothetical protein